MRLRTHSEQLEAMALKAGGEIASKRLDFLGYKEMNRRIEYGFYRRPAAWATLG